MSDLLWVIPTDEFVAALAATLSNRGEVEQRGFNGRCRFRTGAAEARPDAAVDSGDQPIAPEILLEMLAVVAGPANPTERDPTRGVDGSHLPMLTHRRRLIALGDCEARRTGTRVEALGVCRFACLTTFDVAELAVRRDREAATVFELSNSASRSLTRRACASIVA
jgi:hypothetical protein